MKFLCILVLFFTYANIANSFDFVGWYNGDQNGTKNINYTVYTHIVTGSPKIMPDGTAVCDTSDELTQSIVNDAHQAGRLVQWRAAFDVPLIFNNTNSSQYMVKKYLGSIGTAMNNCNIDGIEFDFEWGSTKWNLGLIPEKEVDIYTDFLTDVKNSVGDLLVSADIGTWGLFPNGWVIGFLPWLNVTKFNNGPIDFVNVMSYHWNRDGSIYEWEKDVAILRDVWGYDMAKVNLAIPYFSMNYSGFKIHSEPLWSTLSKSCPNAKPSQTVCDEIVYVSKDMNYRIGKLAVENKFRGLFPWALNYDSYEENNNTLVQWAYSGVQDTLKKLIS